MKLRRINRTTSLITIFTFLVCFVLSLWYVPSSSFKYSTADQQPILRSASNTGISTANFRRNADNPSIQLVIIITNYLVSTANNHNPIFAYVNTKTVQSHWLLCGKISIPTRADPNLLIA